MSVWEVRKNTYMVLIQAWISKPSQLYKCECGLLLLSIHFSQYNKEDNIPSLRFIPQGIFEFCRQKVLWFSREHIPPPPPAPLLAYNSEVAKLALSKLLKIFTCGLMSIKKVLPPKNCSLEFYWEIHLYLSSQWISTIQLCLYHLQQYNSGKTKGGFVSDRRQSLWLFTGEAGPKQMIWKYPKISYYIFAM